MANIVKAVIIDDIDGSDGAQTVRFRFEGIAYEIDLTRENRARLEQVLAPYIQAGRKVPATRSRRQGRSRSSATSPAQIRAWAKERGLKVSERGRIPADLVQQARVHYADLGWDDGEPPPDE